MEAHKHQTHGEVDAMTTLAKPLRRETAVRYRGRPLVVELHAGYLTLRQKGTRQPPVALDYRTAMEVAFELLWRQQQADRKAARKAKG